MDPGRRNFRERTYDQIKWTDDHNSLTFLSYVHYQSLRLAEFFDFVFQRNKILLLRPSKHDWGPFDRKLTDRTHRERHNGPLIPLVHSSEEKFVWWLLFRSKNLWVHVPPDYTNPEDLTQGLKGDGRTIIGLNTSMTTPMVVCGHNFRRSKPSNSSFNTYFVNWDGTIYFLAVCRMSPFFSLSPTRNS